MPRLSKYETVDHNAPREQFLFSPVLVECKPSGIRGQPIGSKIGKSAHHQENALGRLNAHPDIEESTSVFPLE